MSAAIQKVEQGGALDTAEGARFTREQVELIKRMVCPKGIPDDEFKVFLHQCERTGMDPLTKEAYCVPRRTKVPKDGRDEWVTNYVFQASADGMRARAGRFADFHSSRSAAVYEADACTVDVDGGEVKHTFNPCKARGRLVGAWGKVTKRNGEPVVVWLPVGSRSGNSSFWSADAGGMLAKCAEFSALRKAYPVHLGGVYATEEMPSDEAAPTRTDEVEEALQRATGEATAPAPKVEVLPPAGPTVTFGDWKGRPIDVLTLDETEAAIHYGEGKVMEQPKAKWAKALRDNLDLLEKHRDNLRAKLSPEPEDAQTEPSDAPREPGEEG